MESTEKRSITIARALGRIKIIDKQLTALASEIASYSAGCSKGLSRLSKSKDLAQNHKEATEYMSATLQKFKDLAAEKATLRTGVERTNLATIVEIGGKKMSIVEARYMAKSVIENYKQLNNSITRAVLGATSEVNNYNSGFSKVDDATKAALMADVEYFIDIKDATEIRDFVNIFEEEVNTVLNEVNATTEVIFE